MVFILGKKIKMTQVFEGDEVIPVTEIKAGPCFVLQIKNMAKDGYEAVQVGFDKMTKAKNIKKYMKGKEYRFIKEFRTAPGELKVGDEIKLDVFKKGDLIDASGLTKGRGFTGVVKRHGFHGHNKTHGTKDQIRMPGSIGSTAQQRVNKGKRMAGRMGVERVTLKNLQIIEIQPEKNILLVSGAVPGGRNGLVEIKNS